MTKLNKIRRSEDLQYYSVANLIAVATEFSEEYGVGFDEILLDGNASDSHIEEIFLECTTLETERECQERISWQKKQGDFRRNMERREYERLKKLFDEK